MALIDDPTVATRARSAIVEARRGPPPASHHQPTLDAGLPGPALFDGPPTDLELDRDLLPGVGFHPAVAVWFRHRFGQPTPPQAQGWPPIHAGHHTLIAAPTGSGKTLAGFLMAINDLYLEHAAGRQLEGTRVVYVSPLKALAVDIAENLEAPLAEIAATARRLGLDAPDLTVAVRTGDTPPSERQAMVRRPRTFVVTTPESLFLLVTADRSRHTLGAVGTVIVDEIHAMARDKRGAHLALTLERLEHVCLGHRGQAPVRVGLSATQRPIETVADLLVGDRPRGETPREASPGPQSADHLGPPCTIVDAGHQRHLDLAIELPDGELEAVTSGLQMDSVLDRVAELVEQHRTTLVFVNTRRLAERLAHQLAERLDPDDDQPSVVAAHHGSLSKDRRHRVERRLRAGELKALVATASLELGIDVGPVELVCQIGSPRSIATFLQRVGRSNHTRHGTPRGRLYPLTRDELVECAGLLAAVRGGRLDTLQPPEAPIDILAQHLVAETAAEEWEVEALFELVTRAHHYRALDREAFDRTLDLVCDGIVTGRGRRAAWVHRDAINGLVRGRRGARYVALTSGGAIPEIYDMRVVAEPDATFIGTVNEDWAMESSAGDIFLLGSSSWRILGVSGGEVRVADAGDAPPTVPFWAGEAPARTAELSEEVSALRARVLARLDTGGQTAAIRDLTEHVALPDDAARTIVTYLAAGRATLGCLPTSERLVMERFFDQADGTQLVIHSPLGGRINRAMGYALRKKFCVGFNFELQAAASDDAVVISLGPHHSFPLDDVARFLTPDTIRETLTQAVLDQPAFQSRWRWNLNRALVVLRLRNGRRNPPPIQRMESDDLLAALFPDAAACQENVTGPITVPDHPLVAQTIHDTLTEGLDVDGLIELWRRLETGQVRITCVETAEPSVLAHEILTARPYAFLDDGELPDRRTLAVSLRRGLPPVPTEMGALLPEAIDEVQAECRPDPRTPDELHDLLRDTVLLHPDDRWRPLFTALQSAGRATQLDGSVGVRWMATESIPAVRVLIDDRPDGDRFPETVATDLLRGHLEFLSPVTAPELEQRTGLRPALVAAALATLESEGSAIQGRFRPTPDTVAPAGASPASHHSEPRSPQREPQPVEWCSRRLLARMQQRSRSTRRTRVRAVSVEAFVRFLTRWQHVAPGSQLAGPAGLDAVVGQLQGWAAPTAAWEPELLGRRLAAYEPAWLDRHCHDGRVQWLRLRPSVPPRQSRRQLGASRATPIAVIYRQDRPWLTAGWRGEHEPAAPSVGALAEIVAVLADTGPRFAAELAAETGRLPTDVETALWEGVARGLLAADGFEAIRSLTERRSRPARQQRSLSRLRRADRSGDRAVGRWALIEPVSLSLEPDDVAEAVADQLLQRWGVVFHSLAAVERLARPWREIQWALRRLEDRGLVLGGRFVAGMSGEQFALPEAAAQLGDVAKREPTGLIEVCGADPLNLSGILLPGDRIPARRGTRVVIPAG